MEITTTTIHDLNWDFPDANEFNATITNGKITALHFRDVGDLTQTDLCSVNEKYLRNIYKALKGLFQQLDEIRGLGNLQLSDEEEGASDTVLAKFNEKMKSLTYARINSSNESLDDRILSIK